MTAGSLHNSLFLSFNLFIFTKDDGTTINNENRKKLNKKKMLTKLDFVNFKKPQEKIGLFEKVHLGHLKLEIFLTFS